MFLLQPVVDFFLQSMTQNGTTRRPRYDQRGRFAGACEVDFATTKEYFVATIVAICYYRPKFLRRRRPNGCANQDPLRVLDHTLGS